MISKGTLVHRGWKVSPIILRIRCLGISKDEIPFGEMGNRRSPVLGDWEENGTGPHQLPVPHIPALNLGAGSTAFAGYGVEVAAGQRGTPIRDQVLRTFQVV
jgi:hypothetical protein